MSHVIMRLEHWSILAIDLTSVPLRELRVAIVVPALHERFRDVVCVAMRIEEWLLRRCKGRVGW